MLSTFQCDDLRYGLTREPRLDSRSNLVAQRSDQSLWSVRAARGESWSASRARSAEALQEVAERAIAIRENMARLRALRLAKEAGAKQSIAQPTEPRRKRDRG